MMKSRCLGIVLGVTGLVIGLAAAGAPSGRITPALREAASRSAPGERVAAWVFFTDKGGGSSERISDARDRLTPHAWARRARNRGPGRLVDARDVRVEGRYIDGVARAGGGVRHVSRWLNAISVEVAPGDLERIAGLPFVVRLDLVRACRAPRPPEPESMRPTTPPESAALLDYGSSLAQNTSINVPPLHDMGLSGAGVLICMMDTGFNNLQHVAFQSMDILATRDFVNGDSVVSDQVGQMGNGNHGTYTLSVIGAFAPGLLIGPAWGATYILAKTENSDWERHIEEDAWVAAAEWADSIGADIISSSVSYSTGFTDGDLDYAWTDLDGNTAIITIAADIAASRGILVVNSAGNGGYVSPPANTLGAPGDGDSVLTVGAVDAAGIRAPFSSVGPTADGRTKPDVMAMGVSVSLASVFDTTSTLSNSGTSFACPLVAGAVALVLEARPASTNGEIMDALRQTASRTNSPDRLYGWGTIDAAAAAAWLPTGAGPSIASPGTALHPAHPNPFNPSTTIEFDLRSRVRVDLSIFDVRGTRVATLVDAVLPPGRRSVVWNGTSTSGGSLPSGVYVCRLSAGGEMRSRKLLLLK